MASTKSWFTSLLDRIVNPGGAPDAATLARTVSRRRVLITGASFGIGEAASELLASVGAKVILVARTEDKLRETVERIRAKGGEAFYYPSDLSQVAAVEELWAKIAADHGGVDILVNNAGKSIRRSVKLSLERFQDFQRTIDINYTGPLRLLTLALPGMIRQEFGHIVNISTIGVRVPPLARWGAYQASKAAYDIMLRSIDQELRHDGIFTSSIYMTLVRTRMSAPTPDFENMPGLSAEDAAGIIARALVSRERIIEPWWGHPAQVATTLFDEPADKLMGAIFPYTDDSESAKAFKKNAVE